jgi:phosphoglycolate phosphatase-like HAD superfamily hydrolase
VGNGGVQSATTMVEELRRELNSAEEEMLTVGDILVDSLTFRAQGMMMMELEALIWSFGSYRRSPKRETSMYLCTLPCPLL